MHLPSRGTEVDAVVCTGSIVDGTSTIVDETPSVDCSWLKVVSSSVELSKLMVALSNSADDQ
jgi:hypothetical protein